MKKAHVYLFILLLPLTTWRCTREDDTLGDSDIFAPVGGTIVINESAHASGTAEGMTETGYNEDDLLENFTFSKTVTVTFGETVQVENAYADAGVTVTISDQHVEVHAATEGVEYVLTGTSTDGSFKIYSEKKFKLALTDLSLSNPVGPAINNQSDTSAFVVLTGTNQLADGSTYTTSPEFEEQKGTLFSEGQLIFSGEGTLTVQGNNNHAIVSDGYIRIHSGTITVTGAVEDAIHCNDYFIADGGTLSVKSNRDGIEVERGFIIVNRGEFSLEVANDGIVASYEDEDPDIDPYLVINGGAFTINSSEGRGIVSKSTLTINEADVTIKSADDCFHAADAIYVNGGLLHFVSTGSNAMVSTGTLTITGGTIIAVGQEGGLNCGSNELKITGGLVFGSGKATSAPTESSSTVYSLIADGIDADQIIHIESADGNEVFTFTNPSSFGTMLFASPKLKVNTTYNVYAGGAVTEGVNVQGVYTKGKYSRGIAIAQFSTTSKVTQIGGEIIQTQSPGSD